MEFTTLVQTAANAGAASTMLMLLAVGLTLAFGVMQMANLGHGHVFMAGSYTVFVLYALGGWPFWAAVAAAVGVCAAIGLAIERGIFRQVRGDVVAGFIATAGLIFIFEVFMGQFWGWGLMKIIPKPYMMQFSVMGASMDFARIQLIPFAVAAIGGLIFFMRRFKLGRALRAVAQDPEAASIQGISINKITALAMAIAGALAGLAGGLMSTIYAVTPYLGHAVILPALVTVVVGGLGSVEGTILAAVILGFTQTFVTTLTDGVTALMVMYAVMGIVLAVRPQGLMGRVIA